MATVNPVIVNTGSQSGTRMFKWNNVTSADTATGLVIYGAREVVVHVPGDFGSPAATVAMEGSHEVDVADASRTYVALLRADGTTAVSGAAAYLMEVLNTPAVIRPVVTVGTAESVDIYVKLTYA